ncbi:lipoyltransferase [Novosphingobium sp.]|uniref:lipoyltransferase n=1 Tax=Novosphingobium sp. TaxID=1874826 RepID=UPI002B498F0E|nr:lipoyltransferase [Novosphingobium sp.]HKR93146.1 lipoyltransferase [Novosphingobium sp.]
MKFDSNRAWLEAMAAVSANRQVLLPVAGVFFMLPTLLSTVFLTGVQTQLLQALGKPEMVQRIMADHTGLFLGFGLGGLLVQGAGYLAIMALLSERGRLTVGQAIVAALRALPTLVAAVLLTVLGIVAASLVLALLIGGLFALIVGTGAASAIVAVAMMVAMIYVSIKLSLVVPVVVNEGITNPLAALVRSWRLTRHNSLRLFGFFVLLMIAYIAIAFMVTIVLVAPLALLVGEGRALTLFTGVVSGVIAAVSGVILTAVLAYTHRQLAAPSADTVNQTFE